MKKKKGTKVYTSEPSIMKEQVPVTGTELKMVVLDFSKYEPEPYEPIFTSFVDERLQNDWIGDVFEVWSEGYVITGGEGKAMFHGWIRGKTFEKAMGRYKRVYHGDVEERGEEGNKYFVTWGCRYFDNEADARQSFG